MNDEMKATLAFLVVYTTIQYVLQWFTLTSIAQMLGVAAVSWWVLLFLVLTFPASYLLEKHLNGFGSRAFYALAATWLGAVFLLFTTVLIYDFFLLFYPLPAKAALLAGVAVILFAIVHGQRLRVKTVRVPFPKKLRAVQLSDVHVGTIRNKRFLERVVQKTNAASPDVVFITGDLVDGSAPLHPDMVALLDKIRAPIFFVTGNHETYEGLSRVLPILRSTKMRLLRNEVVVFKGVQIAGIEYNLGDKPLAVLQSFKLDKRPSILLYHLPELYAQAAKKGFDLELSGHTHNGQLWPFTYLVYIVHKRVIGLYTDGKMQHYVSPGTGTWGPPMRLGSTNEVTVLELG